MGFLSCAPVTPNSFSTDATLAVLGIKMICYRACIN